MGFFDILTKPQPTMEAAKPKADLMAAIKTYVIYGVIAGLIVGIIFAVVFSAIGAFLGPLTQQVPLFAFFAGLGLLAIIVMPILLAIWSVVGSAISYGILWIIAKVLGGKGTFTQNYYLGSRLVWPLFVAGIIVSILSMIPFIGWLISLLWLLYVLYLMVILLSVANNISKGKAVLVLVILLIIVALLVLLVAASLIAAIMAGSAMGSGLPY
jgi:hypothetical protein